MKKILKFYTVFLILTIALRWNFYQKANFYQIHFLDVDQGDATLIVTPSNCRIVIDGGKPGTISDTLINHLPFGNYKFDLVVATHPDLDHYGGLIKLSQDSGFQNLVLSLSTKVDKIYQYFLDQNQDTTKLYPLEAIKYSYCGLIFEFLSFPSEDSNASSVITIVTLPDSTTVFLGGDIEVHEENQLMKLYPNLKVDILKANHHGSKTSNAYDFMQHLNPKYLIVSAGKNNSYNHPHSSVVINAKKLGINIRRTDLEGTVSFFF